MHLGNFHGSLNRGKQPLHQEIRRPAPPAQQDIDHLIQEQLRNLHGQRDHGGQPLRRDRDDDDLWNSHGLHNRGIDHLVHCNWGIAMVRKGNLHDLETRVIDHHVQEQLGNYDGPLNCQDHGNRPLHHDREIDDLR